MKEKYQQELNRFLRVRSYMRYSSVHQDDGFSIEYQTAEINEYLKRHGMELSKAHVDQAATASKNIDKREAFFELVRDVQAGLVDVIIVYKMSRMFRNSGESDYYRRIFRKHKVKIISVTEIVDDESSSGRLNTNMMSVIDQYQSEVIADHVRSGLREMAKQCLYTGRPLLMGYSLHEEKHGKKKRKRFVVNEEEAPLIRRLFQLYADGNSYRTICKIFKTEGIKTRRGFDFSEQAVKRILKNDFYIGTYRYKVEGYDEIVIENGIPAVIDKELFDAVRHRMGEIRPQMNPRRTNRLYALTGKIVCGKCGSHYIGTNSQSVTAAGKVHYNYYTCNQRKALKMCDGMSIRKDWAEEEVLKAIKTMILNDERIEELSVLVSEMCSDSPNETSEQLKELKSLERETRRRYDKFIATFFDDEGKSESHLARSTLSEIESELYEAQKKIAVLTERLKYSITPESIKKHLINMLSKADQDDIEIWKEVYDAFVDKIIVTDDDMKIRLRVYPSEVTADKDSNALPNVPLSAKAKRLYKYRPNKFT